MNVRWLNLKWISLLPLRSSLRWALLITMVLSLVQTTPAYAASLVVNTLDDELNSDGDCSLREAIQSANDNIAVDACPAGEAGNLDEISFAVSGTITLTAQLEVTAGGPLLIRGANAFEVSGGGLARVMFINPGAVVTLEELAISNGAVEGGSPLICSPIYCGGGIYSTGTLALDHVVVADNSAGSGGGIYNGGILTISDSTISGNSAGHGGGIYNSGTLEVTGGIFSNNDGSGIYNGGTLNISDSTISGNSAGAGGGISNDGTLNITNSTVTLNFANGEGGGIGSSGQLTITDSTVSNNQSHSFGGGISSGGTTTITNSTVSGNWAWRFGGAMILAGTATLTGSTVWNNVAESGVGGIFNYSTLTVSDSLMKDNYGYGECGGSFNIGTLTVTDNSRLEGSGICNVGTLAVSNSTVVGSQIFNAEATENLGIMYEYGPGIGTITNSSFSGSNIINVGTLNVTGITLSDTFGSQGAGIYNGPYVQMSGYGSDGAGILTLTDSTVSNNHGNQGGGIFNFGTLDVTRSTVSGNTAYHEGGGIYNAQMVEFGITPFSGAGILTLTNSTVSGNSASQSGGIHNSGTVTIRNSTLSGNHIEQYDIGWDGRGRNITNDAGTLSLYSSIVAYAPSGPNCDGAIIDAGYNIEDGDTCSLVPANGSLTNTDPLLGPLQDNGGPTQTHALLPASPAVDTGDPLNCPATDQRGVSRPLDGNLDGIARCDMGAYELGVVATIDITPTTIRLPSKGTWITAYIELPNGFNVAAIDLSTVRLQLTIPAANQVAKVGDHDKDGNPDIMVQFSQQALITDLGGVRGEVVLLVTGRLRDGTPFQGGDTIFVGQK